DGALVDGRDALHDLAVARNVTTRLDENEIAFTERGCGHLRARRVAVRLGELDGLDVLARFSQRVGLRLAAALGHRLGEIREEDGEPQPRRDAADEARRRLAVA